MKLHKYFPTFLTNNVPKHVSLTLFVITFNVSVMMSWFTEMHRELYPHFVSGYLGNWVNTFLSLFLYISLLLIQS